MKKQKIQLIVVVCILVLCIGGYFAAKNLNAAQEEEASQEAAKTNVTQVAESDVTEMEYMYNGETINLVKDGDTWYDNSDKSINLSQSDITTMLGYACNISTATVIDKPESLDTYGLKNPVNTISLTLSDGSVVQIMVGDYVDITGEYYAMVPGDSNVYTIDAYVVTGFEKSIDDLIDTTDETTTAEATTEE